MGVGPPVVREMPRGEPPEVRASARRVAARAEPPEDVFVVSVGNIALGGTGKTPVTLALARDLDRRGRRGRRRPLGCLQGRRSPW